MNLQRFRQSIFSLSNKRFGTLAEIAVSKLLQFDPSNSVYYDLSDKTDGVERVEVKFSRAVSNHKSKFNAETLLEELARDPIDRAFSYDEWRETDFSCNIQHVKPTEFDVLIYGIFFSDRVLVFLLTPKDLSGPVIRLSRQSLGNELEGQFSINARTLQEHLDKHYLLTLSYADLLTLFSK